MMEKGMKSGLGSLLTRYGQMEHLDEMFMEAPIGICVTDADGTICCFNKAYELISGMTREEMLGSNVHELVKNGQVSVSGTEQAIQQGKEVTARQEFQTGRWAAVNSVPVFNGDGELDMVVTYAQGTNRFTAYEDQMFALKHVLQVDHLLGEKTDNEVWNSSHLTRAMKAAKEASESDMPVLISGEPGTGKKRVAIYICRQSSRKDERFVTVPCGVMPEGRLERELFGDQGRGKLGLLEIADRGTVFFDEVGALSLPMQEKLLRVIKKKEIVPVGSTTPRKVDVRVLAATVHDLELEVEIKEFNKELYYRLSVFPILMPSLRHRKEDILPLVDDILREMGRQHGRKKVLSKAAAMELLSYDWPGNVSELRNVVELAAISSVGERIEVQDLAIHKVEPVWEGPEVGDTPINVKEILEELEYAYILKAYDRFHNVRKAAASLSMDAATYVRKRKKYGQRAQDNRKQGA